MDFHSFSLIKWQLVGNEEIFRKCRISQRTGPGEQLTEGRLVKKVQPLLLSSQSTDCTPDRFLSRLENLTSYNKK